ncbi:unnamed protein product, partial [Brenthis ino]
MYTISEIACPIVLFRVSIPVRSPPYLSFEDQCSHFVDLSKAIEGDCKSYICTQFETECLLDDNKSLGTDTAAARRPPHRRGGGGSSDLLLSNKQEELI